MHPVRPRYHLLCYYGGVENTASRRKAVSEADQPGQVGKGAN